MLCARTMPRGTRFARVFRGKSRLIWHACLLALSVTFFPSRAHAYAWMIRHGYTQCAQCHVDPSGAGPMTEYGRAMAEQLLRTRYWFDKPDDAGSTPKLELGDSELAQLGGDLRVLSLHTKIEQTKLRHDLIWMQADLDASIQKGRFVASGSLGYAPRGALGAALTRGTDSNLVSRQHWVGYWLDDDQAWLLRAGRMNVPFGIRNIEHTLWARAYTRANIDDQQQYGVSCSFLSDRFHAELLGILGNFQLRPDAFRERGYSLQAELFPMPTLGVGVSSRITHVELDTLLLREEWRHAHGVFTRWLTPWQPLVILSEWDYVLESPKYQLRRKGVVGYAQADIEATQGVHFILTGEASNVGVLDPPVSYGGWLSYAWFFAPHADIRLDNVFQSIGSSGGRTSAISFLLQAHLYL